MVLALRFQIFSILIISCSFALLKADEVQPPNIIIILADDMGYSDPGCFGGEMNTPGINRLAKDGVRLTQFRNGGMCVVSRACLLTGNYYKPGNGPFKSGHILSERLKSAGYRTGIIGKWHLPGSPLDRGFDHFYGFQSGAGSHFKYGKDFFRDRESLPEDSQPAGYYSADAFTTDAIDFVNQPADQPFFLYLSYQTPHSPLQAPAADIQANRGKYMAGWDAVRAARFERQKQLGVVSASAELPSRPLNLPKWEDLTEAQRSLEDLRMATYRAMVERMDAGIERLTLELEAKGKLNNTIIFFMSDNGTDPFSSGDAKLLSNDKLPGDADSNFQPGMGWAYASATPWRLYKISQHGGGVTTGAVIRWPVISEVKRVESTPLHMIDVLPTLLEMAKVPGEVKGVVGESFVPMLMKKPWNRKVPLFFQFADNRAIRTEDWTMAAVDGGAWELFDTRKDPFENANLSKSRTEIVRDLDAQWTNWYQKVTRRGAYEPNSTSAEGGYSPQGDRGTGVLYVPSAMPKSLEKRYRLKK